MSAASDLLEYQRAEDRVMRLRSDITTIEASLAGDPELDRAREELRERDAARQAVEEAVGAAEREASALRQRAAVIDRQLYGGSVRNPNELLTLQRELDEVRGHLATVEDTELARMEEAESAQAAAAQAQERVHALEERHAAAAGPDTARLAERREDLTTAEAERDRIAAALAPAHLALYRRVAARHSPAVVRLSGDACGGCRVPLSINEVRAARTGSALVQCSNCDRIVAP